MTTLMKASHQWATRPDDERFTSLDAMLQAAKERRQRSVARVTPTRYIEARPVEDDDKALAIVNNGVPAVPTHWAFGQTCALVGAPAAYLRTLPTPMVADCLNYGMLKRGVQEVGTLSRLEPEGAELAAATGPNYGRVWNSEVIDALMRKFGDGITGRFTVPGEFGKAVDVSKANTTLYASDRDMFVFLADEKNRIEVPNRRGGQPGSLARGFFIWNSEVGASSLGIDTFLFDFVCCNRIVWGAQGVESFRIRHTSGAPLRFMEEVYPALATYAESSSAGIREAIASAQRAVIDREPEKVEEFLAKRFTRTQAKAIQLAHAAEEGRPIETLFDAVTGATAYARNMAHQDSRIALERTAGKLLNLA